MIRTQGPDALSKASKKSKARKQQPGEAESLTDQAYILLEEMISTLQLPPGTLVSEAELSAQLGIGRTPVREAMQRLARERLLLVLPRRGCIVAPIRPEEEVMLIETRRAIETLVTEKAAVRASESERRQFGEIAARMKMALHAQDFDAFARLDAEFNRLCIAACRNELAGSMMQVAEAHYVVYQAGFRVMEARVTMDFGQRGYRMTADTRTTGLAVLFANSQMRLESEGRWVGHAAAPDRYSAVGSRNGQPRRIEIAYRGNQPDLLAQLPPDAGERVSVTPEQQRGTVDILSAMARLMREAAATGRCDGAVSVYDGRRRLEWSARTEALGRQVAPAGGPWAPVMRCAFSSRVVAGFRHVDDANEIGRPRSGSALLAQVRPDLPPLPVRVEFPYGFLGPLRAELVRIEDPRARRSDGSGE